ncbi:hypothetical protein [Nonomuraea salmonea]|uniref:SPOR domain-containing protein n=1 Tax=Nonomuraea salmonea TaxID=46181 RepID=A0ABV5P3D1_9ACTN
MGCGCNSGNGRQVTKYRVTFPNGRHQDYPTKAEAETARKNAGATAPVRPVKVQA